MEDFTVSAEENGPIAVSNGTVDVYTEGIPPHIKALPEEEQGPALMQAILDRKKGLHK